MYQVGEGRDGGARLSSPGQQRPRLTAWPRRRAHRQLSSTHRRLPPSFGSWNAALKVRRQTCRQTHHANCREERAWAGMGQLGQKHLPRCKNMQLHITAPPARLGHALPTGEKEKKVNPCCPKTLGLFQIVQKCLFEQGQHSYSMASYLFLI